MARQPEVLAESARVLLSAHRYDGRRVAEALGLRYTTLTDTL